MIQDLKPFEKVESQGSSPNSELGWPKDAKEFTGSVVPNKTRMTSYCYAPKPILKVPKNPKRLNFVIKDGHIEVKGSKLQKLRIWSRTESQYGLFIARY